MKSFVRLSLLLIITTASITSCKKSVPKATKHIPKNALAVATINTKSLQGKLAKNQASIENILKSLTGNDTSAAKGKQEWEDLKSSGIDLDENFYVSVVQKGGGMANTKGSAIMSGIATLKNASDFEAYVKKKSPGSEIRKEKNYSYTSVKGGNLVAWGDDLIVMMNNQRPTSPEMEYDSTSGTFNFKQPVNAEKDLKTEMDSYFNLKEDASVSAIPEFRDLMQDKGDASFWVNSSSSMEDIPLPLPKLKELLGNSFTAATVNFEDGKVLVNSKSYYSSQLRDLLNNYKSPDANLGLIENFPSGNINAFAAYSFNPDFFNGLVKYLEVGGIVDGYLTKMMGSNYTLQELLKAIKGDFALVVSDFSMPATDTTAGMNMRPASIPDAQVIVNMPVGDKAQMNRLMDKLVEMKMMEKVNNEYRLISSMQLKGWQVIADGNNLIIASSEALLTAYRSKSKKATIDSEVMNGFKGKPGVAYVNIESILNGIPANANGRAESVLPKAKETFKDFKAYSNNFNGKYLEGHIELRFKNEKENSLNSMFSFFETVSKEVKMNEKTLSHEEMMAEDSLAMAVPEHDE